ncbi:hypothetical protein DL93DRAFT_2078026 [Clavulina sp. PMI_390]|nr:hypothetical protein DL93DRAFT_2078026 [Clavulina sp. PMI_390]
MSPFSELSAALVSSAAIGVCTVTGAVASGAVAFGEATASMGGMLFDDPDHNV